MSEYSVDTVQLLIDGNDVTQYVRSYEIEECFFKGPDSFSAKMAPGWSINLVTQPHYYQWIINSVPIQYGIINQDSISGSKKDGIESTVEGCDLLWLLTKNYSIFDQAYSGNLIDIITRFLNNNSIVQSIWSWEQKRKPLRNGTANAELSIFQGLPQPGHFQFEISSVAQEIIDGFGFSLIKPNLHETLWDFITKLTNQLGLVIKHKPDSSLTLQIYSMFNDIGDVSGDNAVYYIQNRIPSISPVAAQLNNVLSFEFKENIDDFSVFVKLIGDIHNTESPSVFALANTSAFSLSGRKSGTTKNIGKVEGICSYKDKEGSIDVQVGNIGYQGIPKFKVVAENQLDLNIWSGYGYQRQQIINNIMINQMRTLYKVKYTLAGHSGKFFSNSGTQPYQANRLCTINDDYLQLSNSDYLVSGVVFRGSKENAIQETIMELVISDYQSGSNFRGYNGHYWLPSPPPERIVKKASGPGHGPGQGVTPTVPVNGEFGSTVFDERGNAEWPGPVITGYPSPNFSIKGTTGDK
jgi:hypothetical protein